MKLEIIEPLSLSIAGAARVPGPTFATLLALLNERSRLSVEMALRVEKACGLPMETMMRMQNSYGITQARKREDEINVAPFERLSAERVADLLIC